MSHPAISEHLANMKVTTAGAVLTGGTTGATGGVLGFLTGMTLDDAVKVAALSASLAMFFYYAISGAYMLYKWYKESHGSPKP
ncbi:MAG: hypothetical protein KGJ09_10700 [Candidatus Omnitrophica bacterium]|nr:hypothetical protein [Candidatus Omnitrophota bacterium]